jgi:hypothetical protein
MGTPSAQLGRHGQTLSVKPSSRCRLRTEIGRTWLEALSQWERASRLRRFGSGGTGQTCGHSFARLAYSAVKQGCLGICHPSLDLH